MFKNLNPSVLGISGHQSEIIELALTYGFAGIDLNIAEFATRVRLKGLPYARRLIDSAKIRVGTFALPVQWDVDDETFQKELKKLPEYGEAARPWVARGHGAVGPGRGHSAYHENFEFHRHRLQDICAALRPSGVRLALGFQAAEYLRRNQAFQFIHDPDALTLLLNMVAAPNVGLLLDAWDWVAGGGTIENIRKLPPGQIVAVQVAEMPAGVPLSDLDDKSRLLPSVENRRIDVPGVAQRPERDRLRRARYREALAGCLPKPPSRCGRQADRRGIGQSLAGGRPAVDDAPALASARG